MRNFNTEAFFDGLAAPAYLFGYRKCKLGKKTFKRAASSGLADDWRKIGLDLQRAMNGYGATNPI